jgi:MGT family glycosyltransferase
LGTFRAPETSQERGRATDDPVAAEARLIRFLIEEARSFVEPIRANIRRVRPDVIIVDPIAYAGALAAVLEGVPHASASSALMSASPPGFDRSIGGDSPEYIGARDKLFQSFGVSAAFARAEYVAPSLHIIFSTAALLGDSYLPPNTRLVGPSSPPPPPGDDFPMFDADRPLVYVSLGTRVHNDPVTLRALVEAVCGLDVNVLVGAGRFAREPWMRGRPGSFVALEHAPQIRALERATVFISHGGANSVMEAVLHGVPLLVVPLDGDQHLQAFLIARSGAGISLPKRGAADDYREALRQLLALGATFAERACAIRASYRSSSGAATAADLVEQLAEGAR